MHFKIFLLCALPQPFVLAFTTSCPTFVRRLAARTRLQALDYSDPVVSEEFTVVQEMAFDEVETELGELGIPAPPTMNEFDIRMMLTEVRMRSKGTLPGTKKRKREKKASYTNKFEEALHTKPRIGEMYDRFRESNDNNSLNAMIDFINDEELATTRYGTNYQGVFDEVNEALVAKKEVTGPKLDFSGFPANMGEAALQMTFASLGEVISLTCKTDENGLTLTGTVEFSEVDAAATCFKQYEGMDMGMGSKIEMTPL